LTSGDSGVQSSAERCSDTAGEVLGRNVSMLMPSPDLTPRQLHHYVTTGEQKIIGIGRESRIAQDGAILIHLSVGEMTTRAARFPASCDLSDRVAGTSPGRAEVTREMGEMAAVVTVKNDCGHTGRAAGDYVAHVRRPAIGRASTSSRASMP
jgi:hypothetical protein